MNQIRQKNVFIFDSERTTSSLQIAQVVRVAIDLKNLVPETGMDTDWEHFCRETIYSIENRWNRKLD